jgi:hypothetical protein
MEGTEEWLEAILAGPSWRWGNRLDRQWDVNDRLREVDISDFLGG